MMDPSDGVENLNHIEEAVALNDVYTPAGSTGQQDTSPDMLRFFFYNCFNSYY